MSEADEQAEPGEASGGHDAPAKPGTPSDADIDTGHLTEAAIAQAEAEAQERQRKHQAIYDRGKYQGLQVEVDVDFYPEAAEHEPGENNIGGRGFDLHPQVTFVSAGFLLIFIALSLIFSDRAETVFSNVVDGINTGFGWFYIMAANVIVISVVFFAASRYGKIRIGGPKATPEFSNVAWYAMLMSAGMGIGLMFWSVAEPINHLDVPSPFFGLGGGEPGEQEASAALVTSFFHWGVHPWAIYALVAIGLSFFAYNRGLPLTFRSVFYPVLGPRIYGAWGNAIDIVTVLATLFGLAVSLGFGVQQASAGLNYLTRDLAWFTVPTDTWFQVALIGGITLLATFSVAAGLDAGVKRLSQINMGLAAALLVFVMIAGPTLLLLSLFSQSTGSYIGTLPEMSWWNEAFREGSDAWQGGWTVFYWGWWISWSPFVGMFIARISKGRTVREMAAGVIVVPSILSFFWISVFGGTGLNVHLEGARDMVGAVEDEATAMFEMFEELPLTGALSAVAVLLVISFFITSSDSGSLVVDHLTSGGKLDSPKPQRIFWALMEGAIAAVLLIGGGLTALESAAVSSGLLFAVILLMMIWSLRRAFHQELELLEGHYDAVIFSQRHAGLLQRTLDRRRGAVARARRAGGRGAAGRRGSGSGSATPPPSDVPSDVPSDPPPDPRSGPPTAAGEREEETT